MKIHFYPVDPVASAKRPPTLAEFADLHGLEMEIHERPPEYVRPFVCPRFYAFFSSTEAKTGGLLLTEYGNGNSQTEAMEDYASKIEGRRLVVNASDPNNRRVIRAPKAFRRSK